MSYISEFARYLNKKIGESNSLAYLVYRLLPNNDILLGREYRTIKNNIDTNAPPQKESLKKMLDCAAQNVPFYKGNCITNYDAFPFIDKKTISKQEDNFFSSRYKEEDYEVITSGGTSGIPAKYYSPKNRYKKEYAYFHYLWKKTGYKNQLRAVIRNTKLPDNKNYKINPITRELVFDAFRNSDEYFLKIYKTIREFKTNYIQAYPSSAYNFLNFCHRKALRLDFVKGVFLSSEAYEKHQQEFFEDVLKLDVISVYGHTEKLVFIYRDYKTKDHIVLNQYGYFDLIDEKGNTIIEENVIGEIVGSTLDDFGVPLIKYKTGDFSSYKKYNPKGASILNDIISRRNDLRIYNKDGTYVSPTALNMHGEFYTKIKGLQYVQKEKGELIIRIIKSDNYTQEDEDFLINFMKKRFHKATKITINYVSEMKKSSGGKILLLETSIANKKHL